MSWWVGVLAGHAVARDYARDGHFSFTVPAGEYVPTAKAAGQPVRVKYLTSRVTVNQVSMPEWMCGAVIGYGARWH